MDREEITQELDLKAANFGQALAVPTLSHEGWTEQRTAESLKSETVINEKLSHQKPIPFLWKWALIFTVALLCYFIL